MRVVGNLGRRKQITTFTCYVELLAQPLILWSGRRHSLCFLDIGPAAKCTGVLVPSLCQGGAFRVKRLRAAGRGSRGIENELGIRLGFGLHVNQNA